jgi:hypothetical protein
MEGLLWGILIFGSAAAGFLELNRISEKYQNSSNRPAYSTFSKENADVSYQPEQYSLDEEIFHAGFSRM